MSTPSDNPRRHDLDALRALAMLLGIGLHAALSFAPLPWPVQDSQQNPIFFLFFAGVHGFRMPLFFLLSGFFTAMLWRRRGLRATLWQRARRIALPLLLASCTIGPLVTLAGEWAANYRAAAARPPQDAAASLVEAIRIGDREAAFRWLAQGAQPNERDAEIGVPALAWAAMRGDTELIEALLAAGAEVNARNGDGGTALHGAAFFGHGDAVETLIDAGADATLANERGETPWQVAQSDPAIIEFVANFLRVPAGEPDAIVAGRGRVTELLASERGAPASAAGGRQDDADWRDAYFAAINSPGLSIPAPWSRFGWVHLVNGNVFHHMWFLWFLCWLSVAFGAYAWLVERTGWGGPPAWLIRTPAHWLLLLPATLFFQAFMHRDQPGFGPDTSTGLLPAPHILGYYGVFYFFGVLYFDSQDTEGRIGRRWWLWLPLSAVVLMPAAFVGGGATWVGPLMEVLYAWLVSFGLMGLCRTWLSGGDNTVRYVSDSSYWLYLIHLPLVFVGQALIGDWRMISFVKFFVLCLALTLVLLLTYQLFVRHTWIGRLLNGPRKPAVYQQTTARQSAVA